MRFKILTATIMKLTVFWDVAPCSIIKIYRRFRGDYCLHHQGMMEAASASEKSVKLYQTTRCNIAEDKRFILSRALAVNTNSEDPTLSGASLFRIKKLIS
jgi:hypothetical protein